LGEISPLIAFCAQLNAGQFTGLVPCVQFARTVEESPGAKEAPCPTKESAHWTCAGGAATVKFREQNSENELLVAFTFAGCGGVDAPIERLVWGLGNALV
jgi:hypothetical protein